MPALLEAGDEGPGVFLDRGVHERAAGLRAQARKEEKVGVPQLHRADGGPRPRKQVVHDDLGGGPGFRRGAHEGLPVPPGAEVGLDALGAGLEAVARRPALAHEVAHPGEELPRQIRAARLEAHLRPRRDPEHEVHEARPGVVGLAELHRGPPVTGPGEEAAHLLARGLRLLPAEDLSPPGADEGVKVQRGYRLGSFDGGAGHPDARPRADAEDGVGPAGHPCRLGLHEGLEVAAPGEGEGDVPRGALETGGPERLARAQARGPRRVARRQDPVALDAHRVEERRGKGAKHHLDAFLALLVAELDFHPLEPPRPEHQLDRTAHRLAV